MNAEPDMFALPLSEYRRMQDEGIRLRSYEQHGMSDSPTYHSWLSMKQRCTNPNDIGYANYGGRGIKVCDRWLHSFVNFYADMGLRPEGMTLDRKDNDGDYEPDNCKWSTLVEQAANQRRPAGETSQYKGVYWNKHAGKWMARTWKDHKDVYLGVFTDELDAALAVERAENALLKHSNERLKADNALLHVIMQSAKDEQLFREKVVR